MGKVALILRVMPKSPDIDLAKVKQAIQERVKVEDIREEPIGFGLKALKLAVIVEDEAGAAERVEVSLQDIIGVERVETIEATLT
ncbi:MAG: elongation factor 1-beta [Methanomicrobiales archaeon]|jgi:elongation factor 1-beta|nr:elongation factor 1-beta [Methanomicrobiales archaeon]